MSERPQLSIEHCRTRQNQLRERMASLEVDRAVVFSTENVQWLTGYRPHRLTRAAVVLEDDGDCILIAPGSEPGHHAANQVRTYPAQWLSTLRQDQWSALLHLLPKLDRTTALELSSQVVPAPAGTSGSVVDVDPVLWELRRRKYTDERAMMRHAIACTDAMYRKAREIIRPGITELQVFQQLQAVAVETAGEPLTDLGNDFQSNSPGGPPRDRPAAAGELMILDLGPAYRGYYADNCRTFAVDGRPTEAQLKARVTILRIFELVHQSVRPGVSCREFYRHAKAMLDEYVPGAFPHHLGHGLGLYPHEAPHLNPHWDDVFEEGDVFTVEPGLYYDELRAGIRIEENFLVTADGVSQLTSTSTELA